MPGHPRGNKREVRLLVFLRGGAKEKGRGGVFRKTRGKTPNSLKGGKGYVGGNRLVDQSLFEKGPERGQ